MVGDTFDAVAFDFAAGVSSAVAVRRLASPDVIELDTRFGAAPSTARLLTDETGAPVGLEGTWPGIDGSTVDAVACRLN